MKQQNDFFTAELPTLKKRGRPASPDSMTGAERMRLHRARLKAAGKMSVTLELDSSVAEALRKFGQHKEETLSAIASRLLADRLLRKR